MLEKVQGIMKKDNKEKMSREESFIIIDEWADKTRSRLYGEGLEETKDMLWREVMDERLVIEDDFKSFKYKLEEPPIDQSTEKPAFEMVKIKKTKIDKVLKAEEKKSRSAQNIDLIKSHCVYDDGEEIPEGFIMRLDPKDVTTIVSVIQSFFY